MQFYIKALNGAILTLTADTVTNNGNVRGNNVLWYTLSGNVQQNDGVIPYAIYPFPSWSLDGNRYNRIASITVNPLVSGDVDIYID